MIKLLRAFFISSLMCVFLYADSSIIGKVVRVSDGDTIHVLTKDKTSYKIRLKDIDAPESNQAFGTKSKDNLSYYIAGKDVVVTYNEYDQYGRVVGIVYYNNQDINLKQIEDGFAWVYRYHCNNAIYYNAEEIAKANNRGLWVDKNPT